MSDTFEVHLTDPKRAEGAVGRILSTPAVGAGVVAVVAAILRVVYRGQSAAPYLVALSLVAAGIATIIVYSRLRMRNAGLFLAGGEVGIIDSLGRRKGWPLQELDHLRRCTLNIRNGFRPMRLLVFVGQRGRALYRLYDADSLTPGGVEELCARSGLPLRGTFDDNFTLQGIDRELPGAVSGQVKFFATIQEHPTITGWVVGVIFVVVFFGAFALYIARVGH